MNHHTAIIEMQLWSMEEQLWYGLSWVAFAVFLYYLFRISK